MLSFGVILRLVVSTGLVVGAIFALKWWSTRAAGRSRGAIRVVARAGVSRSAAIAVVDVGARRYLVGAGEHSVNLLAELDPTEDLGSGIPTVGSGPVGDPTGDMVGASSGGAPPGSPGQMPGPVTRSSLPIDQRGIEGSVPPELTSVRPGNGLLGHLRRMTTRVPREVRIHGLDR